VLVSPQLGAWCTTNLVKAACLFPRQQSHTHKIFLTAVQSSPLDVQVSSCRSLKKNSAPHLPGKANMEAIQNTVNGRQFVTTTKADSKTPA